jgi:hypothetical protein
VNRNRARTQRRHPDLMGAEPPPIGVPLRPAPPDLGGRVHRRASGSRTPQRPPIRELLRRRGASPPHPLAAPVPPGARSLPRSETVRSTEPRPTRRGVLAHVRAMEPDLHITRRNPAVARHYEDLMRSWRRRGV